MEEEVEAEEEEESSISTSLCKRVTKSEGERMPCNHVFTDAGTADNVFPDLEAMRRERRADSTELQIRLLFSVVEVANAACLLLLSWGVEPFKKEALLLNLVLVVVTLTFVAGSLSDEGKKFSFTDAEVSKGARMNEELPSAQSVQRKRTKRKERNNNNKKKRNRK